MAIKAFLWLDWACFEVELNIQKFQLIWKRLSALSMVYNSTRRLTFLLQLDDYFQSVGNSWPFQATSAVHKFTFRTFPLRSVINWNRVTRSWCDSVFIAFRLKFDWSLHQKLCDFFCVLLKLKEKMMKTSRKIIFFPHHKVSNFKSREAEALETRAHDIVYSQLLFTPTDENDLALLW